MFRTLGSKADASHGRHSDLCTVYGDYFNYRPLVTMLWGKFGKVLQLEGAARTTVSRTEKSVSKVIKWDANSTVSI